MSPRTLTTLIVFVAVGVGVGCLGEAGTNATLGGNTGGTGGGGGGGGGGTDGGGSGGGGGGVVGADGGSGSGSGGGDGGVVVLSSELPCAAYDVLFGHCTNCHGSSLAGGAPQALNTLAALVAPSPGYPGQSNGQRAVVRMASTASPMPPSGYAAVPAADQSAFSAWVSSGMPTGTCSTGGGSGGGGSDGGTAPDAGPPPPPDPLNAAPTCTSNTYWTRGTSGSSSMEPGWACITCHNRGDGPNFTVAGTVFPTGHEPDSCDGSGAAGAVVTVTDSAGRTARFTANSVGNFSGSASLTFPITAQVSFNGKVRGMATAVPTGDCNSCHTQTGANAAPGRITLPY